MSPLPHAGEGQGEGNRVLQQSLVRRWGVWVLRAVVLTLVVWGICRTALDAQREFSSQNLKFSQLHAGWMIASGLMYAVGMLPACWFWKRTLETMGQHPTWSSTLRAFYVGHLGKYVPGKALVVVLRTSLVKGPRVDATVAATSVFIETLTFMAVGAAVAAFLLTFSFMHLVQQQRLLLLLAVLLALGTGIPTWPPIFRRIIRALQVRRANPQIDEAVAGVDARLMSVGWATISIGWCCFGVSLWAALNAIPIPEASANLRDLPLLTAAVALAMVAGFLSLVPAGAFVREFIVMTLLEPTCGPLVAVISAIVLRIVWMLTEIAIAGTLYLARSSSRPIGNGRTSLDN